MEGSAIWSMRAAVVMLRLEAPSLGEGHRPNIYLPNIYLRNTEQITILCTDNIVVPSHENAMDKTGYKTVPR